MFKNFCYVVILPYTLWNLWWFTLYEYLTFCLWLVQLMYHFKIYPLFMIPAQQMYQCFNSPTSGQGEELLFSIVWALSLSTPIGVGLVDWILETSGATQKTKKFHWRRWKLNFLSKKKIDLQATSKRLTK